MKLEEIETLYREIKNCFPCNTIRKNYFLAACKHYSPTVDVETLSNETPYGGLIGIGDSSLERLFNFCKVLRLHAALHDASGCIFERERKGPGYCYVFPIIRTKCCFAGHLTGILFCLLKKLTCIHFKSMEI